MAEIVYIALGSNKGDREGYLAAARAAIAELADTRMLAASEIEETEPIGPAGQGRYLNQMLAIETGLEPEALLRELEETEPIGPAGQGRYLNQMLAIETGLEPEALLRELQRIEQENDRVRDARWGERTLDLDIVRFGERRIRTDDLVVPHPELPNREFWQRELAQVRGE